MAEIDKINPVIQACLSNAEHLLNAAKDVRKPGQNHIGYHLAALALEEIGKITMIVVSAAVRSDMSGSLVARQSVPRNQNRAGFRRPLWEVTFLALRRLSRVKLLQNHSGTR